MDRSWENRRTWRQSRSYERERRSRSPSSSRLGSRTSTNRDSIRCFKCREYDDFVNECPNLIPEDSDKESNSVRSVSLHLAYSDTGLDMEQYLKHMKGRNGSTSFLPSKRKGGFQREISSEQCLTKEQTKQIYDKVELGEKVKIRKLDQHNAPISPKQETFMNDVNQYEKVLLSDRNTRRSNSQMEQWSILSDNIVYVRSEDNDIMNGIDIKSIDYREHKRMYKKMGKEGGERLDIYFGESPEIMRSRYMDVYDNIYAEVVTTSRFDENVDLSTTYLGRIDMKKEEVMKAEESFPISEQGFVMGKLMNGKECQILLDTGASKLYMSKPYYLRCKSLHNLPKFASKMQRIQVGNGQYVGVLFVILVILEINKHRLEVFTLVSEIFDNIDVVLGIKNLFELEGVIDTRESSFRFLSRSIPIFP